MYILDDNNNKIARFSVPTSVISNTPVYTADVLSLKRNSVKRTAQRWEISTKLEPLERGANALFVLFVTKGTTDAFNIYMPQNTGVLKDRIKFSSVNATMSLSSPTSINITVIGTGFIPKGTFIKIANHSKVYMLKDNISTTGTYGIYPNVQASITGAVSYLDDVIMPVYLDSSSITGMSYSDGILMDNGEIKLVEAL